MATSITVKNPSSRNTLKITSQSFVKHKDKTRWEDTKHKFVAPSDSADVWLESGQQRMVLEEMPS